MSTPESRAINDTRVAYFCMEYGLDASFPIYSGGLGISAGDILKAAKDLRKPFVGVGIFGVKGTHARHSTPMVSRWMPIRPRRARSWSPRACVLTCSFAVRMSASPHTE